MMKLNRLTKFGALGVLGVFMLGGLAASKAEAAPPAFCRGYADIAVRQQANNLRLRCGYLGPRWHSLWQGHYTWCRSVGRPAARSEIRARRRQIVACGG